MSQSPIAQIRADVWIEAAEWHEQKQRNEPFHTAYTAGCETGRFQDQHHARSAAEFRARAEKEFTQPINILAVIQQTDDMKDFSDSIVSEMFTNYCEVFGIHRAYGVESYRINNDTICIIQDISCRGCYDTDEHILPLVYLTSPNAVEMMKEDFKKKQDEKNRVREIEREREILRLQEKIARLEKEKNG